MAGRDEPLQTRDSLFQERVTVTESRETRKRWVQRGRYAVEVDVEVVYPDDDPTEACLEPETVRWLEEIARRAEQGDVEFLAQVGRVFESVSS